VSDLVRQDVIPVLSGYLLLMAMLLVGGRRSRPPVSRSPEHRPGRAGWPRLFTYLVSTAAGGYVLFLAIVLIYYLALGGKSAHFLRDAVFGGAWLGFGIAVPALMGGAWLEHRLGARRPPASR